MVDVHVLFLVGFIVLFLYCTPQLSRSINFTELVDSSRDHALLNINLFI
jgi:hypothetical protein